MSYSQTVSTTVFSTLKVVESAARRCKLPASTLTPEHVDIAKNELYLLLSSLPLVGDQLWTRERLVLPLYEGQSFVELPSGTVDLVNANFRTLQEQTGTETVTATTFSVEFSESTAISTVGVLWSATGVPVALERSDDGATWTTIQSETPDAAAGEMSWFDVSPVTSATYFRVRATSGTLGYTSVYLGNTPTSIPLGVINSDDWAGLANRTFQSSRVSQYWFDRQIPNPYMRIWPVPNATAAAGQMEVWRRRYIMDVGSLSQEIEAPQRWYDAIVAGLAARCAREFIEVNPEHIPQLDTDAASALRLAQMGEGDSAPMRIAPNISPYTR